MLEQQADRRLADGVEVQIDRGELRAGFARAWAVIAGGQLEIGGNGPAEIARRLQRADREGVDGDAKTVDLGRLGEQLEAGGPPRGLAPGLVDAHDAEPDVPLGGEGSEVVTLSIGGALAEPSPGERDYRTLAERLMAEADAALYRAKSAGRDRYVIAERAVR